MVANQEGNFRALLRFRIKSGDLILRQHLETETPIQRILSKSCKMNLLIHAKILFKKLF
jgi:hypothetical protein